LWMLSGKLYHHIAITHRTHKKFFILKPSPF
jgi:hypothetical protein